MAKDYLGLYRSAKKMKARLTEKQIRYAVSQCQKARSTADIASELGVTRRRIQQLWAEFRRTGTRHAQRDPGRRQVLPTPEETRAVLDAHAEEPVGAVRLAARLQENHNTSHRRAYRIMKENGPVVHPEAKPGRRKRAGLERKYPSAMWHTDWHEMRDPRFRGLRLVTYLDDASRCVVAARVFTEATSENAVTVPREAVRRFGTPATMLSDNGSCLAGRRGRRAPAKPWQPTALEAGLLDMGIELINSRPYHPQTNGKLERFHKSIGDEIFHYESLSAYVKYYNERRLHFSLDIRNRQTPLMAFSDKKATDAIRESNPKWVEEDLHD